MTESARVTLQTNELVATTRDTDYRALCETLEKMKTGSGEWKNRLIYGDNLLAMQALLAGDPESGLPSMRGKIDLIYIDPPFDSKADYRTKIELPGGSVESRPTVIEQFAYADTWSGEIDGVEVKGTLAYLRYMYPRLALMRELLSDRGSIYIHIDTNVGHYLKVLADEIFGRSSFINEVIWQSAFSHPNNTYYGSIHQNILFYGKNEHPYFETQYDPYTTEYVEKYYRYSDPNGRKFLSRSTTSPGGSGKRYEWKGVVRSWRYSREKMEELDKEGRLFYTTHGIPRYKQYMDEMRGTPASTIWDKSIVPPLLTWSEEGAELRYATQKPESLLERIIQVSCPPGGIVADFFSGSGTAAAAAEKLNRKWLVSDIGKPAVMVTRKRLIDNKAKPFVYQSIGDYQKEQLHSTMGTKYRIGDLSAVVLNLFGALPFPVEDSPQRNLGRLGKTKNLVYVDSPNKLCGVATLRKAQELREIFMGGWDKVIVLGWNFDTQIGQIIDSLGDKRLEVLVIPPDLLDTLASKAKFKKISAQVAVDADGTVRTPVRFSSIQYLTVRKPEIHEDGSETEIKVELENYMVLSPDALPLDDEGKKVLQDVIAKDPLDLIEYWSIDPDYDGTVFRSCWQDYRENQENDSDPLRVVRTATIRVPKKAKRTICVKAVDVFGWESEVVVTIG